MSDSIVRIAGGARLDGSVQVSGGKNDALPCMAAALLTRERVTLRNVPTIADVRYLAQILQALGADVHYEPDAHEISIQAGAELTDAPPDDLVHRLRGSFLVAGPLLARVGRVVCAAPGGDEIGRRPVDVHLRGFENFGARARHENGHFEIEADQLRGARVVLDYPSVLGTENLILAAVLAEGRTVIVNAAMEPEIFCLGAMLNDMGASVAGAGSNTITIDGVEALGGCEHSLIPDRIEAGTLATAAVITGGDVELRGVQPRQMDAILAKLTEIGATVDESIEAGVERVRVRAASTLRAADVQAVPYPGLATDLQALVTTLLTQAEGDSTVHERVFENRLGYVEELKRMGASIEATGSTAIVHGPTPLRGAVVHGLDIRSAASLVIAALAAEGVTELRDAEHLARGYECLDEKLRSLGADVAPLTPPIGAPGG